MKIFKVLCLAVVALAIGACVRREPGPGEQIGRGVDEMTQGLRRLDTDPAYGGAKPGERDAYHRYENQGYREPTPVPTPEGWESYEDWKRRTGGY